MINLSKNSNKNDIRNLIKRYDITMFMTIEPQPGNSLKYEEIHNCTKYISFCLNKNLIGNKVTKFKKSQDSIISFMFCENGKKTQEKHAHVLFHYPKDISHDDSHYLLFKEANKKYWSDVSSFHKRYKYPEIYIEHIDKDKLEDIIIYCTKHINKNYSEWDIIFGNERKCLWNN